MDKEKCINLIINSKIPKILVIGDFFIDCYIMCKNVRLNPEAPVPLLDIDNIYEKLGGSGNLVNNLVSLGADVQVFGRVGLDSTGQIVKDKLRKLTKHPPVLFRHDHITPIKTRYFAGTQQILRADKEEKLNPIESSEFSLILSTFIDLMKNNKYDLVILSDYNKGIAGPYPITNEYIKICNKLNIPIYVDPKCHFTYYSGCTCIKPNKKEIETIINQPINSNLSFNNILQSFNIQEMIITLGNEGMIYCNKEKTLHIDPTPVPVYDVCGAGDVALSVYSYMKSIGLDSINSVQLSNKMAAVSCKYIGTHTITNTEILIEYANTNKIVQQNYKFEGKKIFVNGCFDLIHPGHYQLLKYAKSLGGSVIVALNSDQYIKKLKGNNRPKFSLENRMKSISALPYVDYVTYFNEDTPEELMKIITPDIYVVGSDHKPDVVNKYVKETVFFERIKEYSSTEIFNII